MRELTESVIIVRYTLTEAAYRDLVAEATGVVQRSYQIRIPIADLLPAARLAVIDLPTNQEGGLNSSFSMQWPAEVSGAPTADDLSDRLLALLAEHQAHAQALADWIATNEALLTDGRWSGRRFTFASDFKEMGCDCGDLKFLTEALPKSLLLRAKKAHQEKAAEKKAELDAQADLAFEAYLANLEENPLQAVEDGVWIADGLPGAPSTSLGHPHGDGCNVPEPFKLKLANIRLATEVERARQDAKHTAQIAEWLDDHGTESQQARFEDGVLPNGELWDAIRDWVFAALDGCERYERLDSKDAPHHEDCYDHYECDISYYVKDATALTMEQHAVLIELRRRAEECSVGITVTPRHHTAWAYCTDGVNTDVVHRYSALASAEVFGRPLSREYAL